MKESTNNVYLTGVLVKKDFEEVDCDVKNEQGQVIGKDKAIRGVAIIRTTDGSENEVKYYATRLTKKGAESALFKGLKTVMNEYKSLEQFPNEADVVKIGAGKISVNDYVNSKSELKCYNEVKANFINRVESKDLETTLQESKFEVEGVVETITDEIIKEVPTGNKIINLMIIGYEGTLIPMKLTIIESMVTAFNSAGFYEGGYAKFVGKLVNTKETTEIIEKMGFGEDNVKIVTKTVSRFEVTSGNPLGTPMDKGITVEEWGQAKTKRQLKLDKKKEEANNNSPSANPFGVDATSTTSTTANNNTTFNPFSGANPFAS